MPTADFLDLYNLFVNDIAGTATIFIFLSFIITIVLLAKFRVPNNASITILYLQGLLLSAFFQSLLAVVLLLVGFFLALSVNRLLEAR